MKIKTIGNCLKQEKKVFVCAFVAIAFLTVILVLGKDNLSAKVTIEPDMTSGSVGFRGVSVDGIWYNADYLTINMGNWVVEPVTGVMHATDNSKLVIRLPLTTEEVSFVFNCSPDEGSCKVIGTGVVTDLELKQGYSNEYGQCYAVKFNRLWCIAEKLMSGLIIALLGAMILAVGLYQTEALSCHTITQDTQETKFLQTGSFKIWNIFWNPNDWRWKTSILFSFLVNFLAYGYLFTNRIYSHDSLKVTTSQFEQAWAISLGRFLQYPVALLRSDVSSIWLIGIISCVLLGFAIYIITLLFDLESKISIFFVASIISVNLSFICLHTTYIVSSDLFALAFLLNTLAVFLMEKREKKYCLLAGILIASSLAIYQAYITVTLVLCIAILIRDCLRNQKAKDTGMRAIIYAGVVLLAGLIYSVALKIVLTITKIEVESGYNGLGKVVLSDYFRNMKSLIYNTYKYPFAFFFTPNGYNTHLLVFVNIACMMIALLLVLFFARKNRISISNRLFITVLIILMPFAANAIFFVSQGSVHMLMMQGLFVMFACVVLLWAQYMRKCPKIRGNAINITMVVLFIVVTWNSVVYSNSAVVMKSTIIESSNMLMNRIVDRVEQLDGYIPGITEVCFWGTLEESSLLQKPFGFERFQDEYAVGLAYNTSVTRFMEENFFTWQTNYNINVNSQQREGEAEIINKMEAFPAKNSVKMTEEGRVLVKLS